LEEKVYTVDYIVENEIDKKAYGFIYIATNLINSKKYIGQRKYSRGWKSYVGSGTAIKKAIKKYGRENFSRDIICFADNKKELNKLEEYYIELYHAVISHEYYNLKEGGDSGNPWSGKSEDEIKEICKKISNNNSKYWSGKQRNNETKKKISQTKTGKYIGEKHPFYGGHHSEESKKKMSEANIGRPAHNKGKSMSKEQRQKLIEIRTGTHHTEETKQKMSEVRRGENNPMYRKQFSESHKKKISQNHYCKGKFGFDNPSSIPVICITTLNIYASATDAERKTGINSKSICGCCKHKRKSAGKTSDGKPRVWMYYKDYIDNSNEII